MAITATGKEMDMNAAITIETPLAEASTFPLPRTIPNLTSVEPVTPSPAFETIDPARLERLNLLWHVIAELRDVADVTRLIDMAPTALCRLGFERAMISRVENSTWLVQKFY